MSIRLTIVGAGPGGYVAAVRAAQRGARVTLVEEGEVGGTCLNRGCIPTKTIIASAETFSRVRHAEDFGIELMGEPRYSLERVRERKNRVIATQVKGVRGLLKSWGVELVEGRGVLAGPKAVRVERKDAAPVDVPSDRIVIATGSRPALLPGFPFDGRRIITSDEAVRFETVPARLLIVGAGVIGSEFAFIYRTFGSDVTVVDMMPRPLATEDEDMSDLIAREMKKAKIRLKTGVTVGRIAEAQDGELSVALSDGDSVQVSQVLVSIGRAMNSDGLGLEETGVARGPRGEITVNERMETNVPGIYAIGDVTGKVLLAHVASRQGLIAVENCLGGNEVMDYSVIPSGIFTMPEVGSVGLREHEARQRAISYRTGRFPYRGLGKSHAMGEIAGLVKILADAESDRILGVHICGAHATDLVHEGAAAMKSGTTAEQLAGMIHAHPTLAEAIMEAAEDVHGMAVHIPKSSRS